MMGVDAFRQRVKIYATDVAEDELAEARQGEMLLRHGGLFETVDLPRRMFRKVAPRASSNGRLPAASRSAQPGLDPFGMDRLRSEAFLISPVAQVVVTVDGLVALVNRQAEMLFGLSPHDIGQPFRDLVSGTVRLSA